MVWAVCNSANVNTHCWILVDFVPITLHEKLRRHLFQHHQQHQIYYNEESHLWACVQVLTYSWIYLFGTHTQHKPLDGFRTPDSDYFKISTHLRSACVCVCFRVCELCDYYTEYGKRIVFVCICILYANCERNREPVEKDFRQQPPPILPPPGWRIRCEIFVSDTAVADATNMHAPPAIVKPHEHHMCVCVAVCEWWSEVFALFFRLLMRGYFLNDFSSERSHNAFVGGGGDGVSFA